MTRIAWSSIGLLIVSLTTSAGGECIVRGSICSELEAADLVLSGDVIETSQTDDPTRFPGLGPGQQVVFRVREAFKGTRASRLTMTFAAGMYQPVFSAGEQVLIYASPSGQAGRWFSGCDRTSRIRDDDPELAALRAIVSGRRIAIVEGAAHWRGKDPMPRNALAGLRVSVRPDREELPGKPREWATVTRAYGRFVFAGVPPGRYNVFVEGGSLSSPLVIDASDGCISGPMVAVGR